MLKILSSCICGLLFTTTAVSQWVQLPASPFTSSRLDDIYFVDDNTGWTCSGDGYIYKTVNGGTNWFLQFASAEYFRSIEFINPTTGFAGTLDGKVFKTTNGGSTWTDFTATLPVPPYGICGISHFGNTVFMVGNWSQNADLYKSFDGGLTWSHQNLNSLAENLVECLFINANEILISGLVALPQATGGCILRSTDGGATWSRIFHTGIANEYVWKLQTRNNGLVYGSVESLTGNATWFVKSTDWGATFQKLPVSLTVNIDAEGIGFVNDTIGFIDGYGIAMYKTVDGGNSWTVMQPNNRTNRFFVLPSGIAYASGSTVWKYQPGTTGLPAVDAHKNAHQLFVSPNPSNAISGIKLTTGFNTYAILEVYDSNKKSHIKLHQGRITAGTHEFTVDCSVLAAGVYHVILRTNEHFLTEKLVVIPK
jgi:photosystem II stability/assembly factor-like uncharacterized protein